MAPLRKRLDQLQARRTEIQKTVTKLSAATALWMKRQPRRAAES
jgi:hypothetical protein